MAGPTKNIWSNFLKIFAAIYISWTF